MVWAACVCYSWLSGSGADAAGSTNINPQARNLMIPVQSNRQWCHFKPGPTPRPQTLTRKTSQPTGSRTTTVPLLTKKSSLTVTRRMNPRPSTYVTHQLSIRMMLPRQRRRLQIRRTDGGTRLHPHPRVTGAVSRRRRGRQ